MDELAGLHSQIALLDSRLVEQGQAVTDRLERIEKALMGDTAIGLTGMVGRLNRLDRLAEDATTVHASIDQRRVDGDSRLHKRVDALEGKWRVAVGIAIGASVASAGGAAWLTSTLLPG